MIKQLLHENWTIRAVGDLSLVPPRLRDQSVPAAVPGCAHTDLMRAELIDDPYLDLNAEKTHWIGKTDWQYRCTFDADVRLFEHERIDLACDGLDTVATIELNGHEIAQTQNMHRSYRFNVTPMLKRGTNELVVTFASPVKYADAMREKLQPRPYVNGPAGAFNFIRKMACNFGWDWGPALTTSGIWRGIRLEGWSVARLAEVRPVVRRPAAGDFPAMIDGPDEGINPFTGKRYSESDPLMYVDLHVRIDVTESGRFRRPSFDRDNAAAELRLRVLDQSGRDVTTIGGVYGPLLDEVLSIPIPDPRMWNPVGHGEQPLYTFEIELLSWPPDLKPDLLSRLIRREWPHTAGDSSKRVAGQSLGKHTFRVGVRTVELDTSPDDIGSKFIIKVNGKPIFCKGFNWIPDDCFLDRACDPARVRARLQQAVDAGANMIRVWGGGIYETDDFYNTCDELGLMVWQDFLFACAMYPEEEPFWSEVEAEARQNVARLSPHPSLVLWNGCNENIWAYRDWGWKDSDEVKGRTWGLNYYLDLLPRIMKEVDPSRPYWAASPWSGDPDPDNGIHPNADTHGNMHVWKPWFREDYTAYREFAARFCSEFGFQGPATYSSIVGAISRTGVSPVLVPSEKHGRDAYATDVTKALDFGSPAMRNRQRSGDRVRDDGDRRNFRHLLRHFDLPGLQDLLDSLDAPDPNANVPYCGAEPLHAARTLPSKVNLDDLHYLLQLNQARALTLGVEWFRSRQPRCMGTLYWQLNDCWPGATTWSCIDGDGKPKPLWYATRRFYEGYLPTIQPEPDGSLSLYLINDTDQEITVKGMNAWRQRFDGAVLEQQVIDCLVPARAVHRVALEPGVAVAQDPSGELIGFGDEVGALWFFKADKELNYPNPRFRAGLHRLQEDEYALSLTADTLLRDVCIFVDRLDPDATISDQLVTMLKGDSHVFSIRSKRELTLEQLTTRPVFRCANEFGLASSVRENGGQS